MEIWSTKVIWCNSGKYQRIPIVLKYINTRNKGFQLATDPLCLGSRVGETKPSLKSQAKQHRKPSSNEALDSAVCIYLKESGRPQFWLCRCDNPRSRWQEARVKDMIWERVEASGASFFEQDRRADVPTIADKDAIAERSVLLLQHACSERKLKTLDSDTSYNISYGYYTNIIWLWVGW